MGRRSETHWISVNKLEDAQQTAQTLAQYFKTVCEVESRKQTPTHPIYFQMSEEFCREMFHSLSDVYVELPDICGKTLSPVSAQLLAGSLFWFQQSHTGLLLHVRFSTHRLHFSLIRSWRKWSIRSLSLQFISIFYSSLSFSFFKSWLCSASTLTWNRTWAALLWWYKTWIILKFEFTVF